MNAKKILIINPYGIGDVLFTTPVVSNLRLAYPQAKISFLANRRTAEFLLHHTDISQVFTYERDEFVKNRMKYLELFKNIKAQGFDMVFDFSLNSSFGFLSAACRIKRRIGFDYKKRGFFLTDRLALSGFENKHMIEYNLDLLRLLELPIAIKQMKLTVPPHYIQWAKQWLKNHDVESGKPWVAVLPGGGASWGASAKNKRWPASRYAHLIDKIVENFDAAIILMGDSREEELAREVVKLANFPVHFAVGQSSVLQLAALLMQTHLAIVNDGGPLHIAQAVGTRTVSIFGPVDPKVYGPYPVANHLTVTQGLPCQPCYRSFRMARCGHINCLNELSVDSVYRKVTEAL